MRKNIPHILLFSIMILTSVIFFRCKLTAGEKRDDKLTDTWINTSSEDTYLMEFRTNGKFALNIIYNSTSYMYMTVETGSWDTQNDSLYLTKKKRWYKTEEDGEFTERKLSDSTDIGLYKIKGDTLYFKEIPYTTTHKTVKFNSQS